MAAKIKAILAATMEREAREADEPYSVSTFVDLWNKPEVSALMPGYPCVGHAQTL